MAAARVETRAILNTVRTMSAGAIEGTMDDWAHDRLTWSDIAMAVHMHFRPRDSISGRPHHGVFICEAALAGAGGQPYRRE
jgi:hypothetical protein